MKCFNSKGGYSQKVIGDSYKVNFVDENNVFVGFDADTQCCEQHGWYICKNITNKDPNLDNIECVVDDTFTLPHVNRILEGWVFDENFFEEITSQKEYYDERNIGVFRLIQGDQSMYLHLYNQHNGYYSHGFTMMKGDEYLHEGHL
jgi:hypothetical protein